MKGIVFSSRAAVPEKVKKRLENNGYYNTITQELLEEYIYLSERLTLLHNRLLASIKNGASIEDGEYFCGIEKVYVREANYAQKLKEVLGETEYRKWLQGCSVVVRERLKIERKDEIVEIKSEKDEARIFSELVGPLV